MRRAIADTLADLRAGVAYKLILWAMALHPTALRDIGLLPKGGDK